MGWGGSERFIEFDWAIGGSWLGVGDYSRWALMRDLALIRLKTVLQR